MIGAGPGAAHAALGPGGTRHAMDLVGKRVAHIRVTAQDRPGLLGIITSAIGENGGNIIEVSHRRMMLDVPAKAISVDISMETRGREHVQQILHALASHGLATRRLGLAGETDPAWS